jgi:hypothetical protein
VQKVGRWCDRHDHEAERTGDPLGKSILGGQVSPYIKRATRYIQANRDHVAIAAALEWLRSYVEHPRVTTPAVHRNATARQRVDHWLSRLKRAGVHDWELMAVIVAMYALREHEPWVFRSDRHFKHQLAIRFCRKAPAPPAPNLRGGVSQRRYSRVTVGTRELLTRELEAGVGLVCFRIAKLLLVNPNTPTSEQRDAMRAPLPDLS